MVCHKCKTTADVMESRVVTKDEKQYLVQFFKCRNKQCEMYGREVGQREMPLKED